MLPMILLFNFPLKFIVKFEDDRRRFSKLQTQNRYHRAEAPTYIFLFSHQHRNSH